jgi:hypothetical protein
MEMIKLAELEDSEEFYSGTRFRIYKVGLNVSDESEDFYEYMLVEIPGEKEHMLLTNVVGHKSGCALAYVKTKKHSSVFAVTSKDVKFSIGTKNTYLIKKS